MRFLVLWLMLGGVSLCQGPPVESRIHGWDATNRVWRSLSVNDADGGQTYLRLYTYYGDFRTGNQPLNQSIGLDSDAMIVRPSSFQDEVRIGRRTGISGWTKFGYNYDIDQNSDPEVIWPNGAAFVPLETADTFDIAYDGTAGGTTDGAGTTGATALTVYYIDANGNEAVGLHTLGTDGDDTTSFSGFGINRIAVSGTGTNDTNASDIIVTGTTLGNQQAIIPAGTGVTEQCIFFTGTDYQAVAKFLWLNVNKLSGGGAPRVTVKGMVYNRGIDAKFEIFRITIDSSVENTIKIIEPIGFNLSSTDVLWFTAETTADNATVNMRFSLNHYRNN